MEGGGGDPAHGSAAASRAAGARSDEFNEEAVRQYCNEYDEDMKGQTGRDLLFDFKDIVDDCPFTADPSDAATRTVPHHIVEGVYARLLAPDATVAATAVEFGPRYLSIADLCAAEASLPDSFPSSACSLNEYVRRVSREAMRPGRAPIVVRGASFENGEPFAAADTPNDVWLSEIGVDSLVDSTGLLAPYADLAMLVTQRASVLWIPVTGQTSQKRSTPASLFIRTCP